MVEWPLLIEDTKIAPSPCSDVYKDVVEPLRPHRVLGCRFPIHHALFDLMCPGERCSKGRFRQSQLVPNGTRPYQPAAPRRNAAPPQLPRSSLAYGIVPVWEYLSFPDLHLIVRHAISRFGLGPSSCFAPLIRLGARGHHLLVLAYMTLLFGWVFGWQPRRSCATQNSFFLFRYREGVDHDIRSPKGRQLRCRLDPRLPVVGVVGGHLGRIPGIGPSRTRRAMGSFLRFISVQLQFLSQRPGLRVELSKASVPRVGTHLGRRRRRSLGKFSILLPGRRLEGPLRLCNRRCAIPNASHSVFVSVGGRGDGRLSAGRSVALRPRGDWDIIEYQAVGDVIVFVFVDFVLQFGQRLSVPCVGLPAAPPWSLRQTRSPGIQRDTRARASVPVRE